MPWLFRSEVDSVVSIKLETLYVNFIGLTEKLDTTSLTGKLVFHIMASIAEFDRGLLKERINARLVLARQIGSVLGRKRLMPDTKFK